MRQDDMARGFALYQRKDESQPPAKENLQKLLGAYGKLPTELQTRGIKFELSQECLRLVDNEIFPKLTNKDHLTHDVAIFLGDLICKFEHEIYWNISSNGYPQLTDCEGFEWDIVAAVKVRSMDAKPFLVDALNHASTRNNR